MSYNPTPILGTIGDVAKKRAEILNYFNQSFDLYESLFTCLKNDEAFYQQPEKLRHPLIFYFGHTATFFINKLMLAKIIPERINPHFESMFAIGVDEMSWDDLNKMNYSWPLVSEVRDYRQKVRALVTNLIQEMPMEGKIDWDSPWWPIMMGIEHEYIHLETSSVLMRQLDLKYITPQKNWDAYQFSGPHPENQLIAIPEGKIERGKPHDHHLYGWDNEYGLVKAEVLAFKAAKYLTSNGEFLSFVNDGGYLTERYWSEEGLRWKNYTKAMHPTFWRKEGNNYLYRTITTEIPLPMNWPVDVNFHEAKAFCNWKSEKENRLIRMPSENEWARILDESNVLDERFVDVGNINLFVAASSTPVDLFCHGKMFDVIGNVWQWCETPIYPYDGFKIHPLYDDFTTPTFDNKHNIIKGGSFISLGNEATRFSRYAFRRHFFQHAGFRYIESKEEIKISDFNYESDTQVSQYSEFHFGDRYFNVPNFAEQMASIAIKAMGNRPKKRALDLGCAVGRASFELTREFLHVDGVDFSARFINVASDFQNRGEIRYYLHDEGELKSFHARKLSDFNFNATANRAHFTQGDATNLKPIYKDYDLILMSNLIDRLAHPKKVLSEIHHRLNIGGLLIVASPYTWMTEYTERSEWIGGFKEKNGESLTTTDALNQILKNNFKRIEEPFEVEFVIRETKRKFQHTLSVVNIFERIQ